MTDGHSNWQGSGHGLLLVTVNTLPCGEPGFAPVAGPPVRGFPVLGDRVILTRRSAPPCVFVTRGEYLEAALAQARKAVQPETDEERWARAKLQGSKDPSAQAILGQLNQAQQTAHDNVRALQDELASLSADERAAPTWVDLQQCRYGFDCLAAPRAPGAKPLVKANPAFFDPSRPTDVQLLSVRIGEGADWQSVLSGTDQRQDMMLTRIANQVDLSALAALVR
jgi:hypothetical protein